MATSSGNSNSSNSTQNQNSGSGEDLQVLMDQRKRKRMESNRESARRSRLRKQKHVDELMAQVAQLRNENNQILTSMNITTQHYLNIEAENSILRAQMIELTQRLQSLDDILNYMNTSNNGGMFGDMDYDIPIRAGFSVPAESCFMNNNTWNMMHNMNLPIRACADLFIE